MYIFVEEAKKKIFEINEGTRSEISQTRTRGTLRKTISLPENARARSVTNAGYAVHFGATGTVVVRCVGGAFGPDNTAMHRLA